MLLQILLKLVSSRETSIVNLGQFSQSQTLKAESEISMECLIELNGLLTKENFNILPLGSYDVFIKMDQLERHQAKLNYYNKSLDCINDEGQNQLVKGVSKHISDLQLRNSFEKFASCMPSIYHIQQRKKAQRYNIINYCNNSRMCFQMTFQDYLHREIFILQSILHQEHPQCPKILIE